ncbi:MAG TPA: hypothetical protein DCY13_08725 [Verrucomicrobiales bacterium]|nr:hypothetical protein [Verrucomicrobiales bacterium]
MNDTNQPPQLPSPHAPPPTPAPLGEETGDNDAIKRPTDAVESMLRHPRRLIHQLSQTGGGSLILMIAMLGVACAIVYGLVIGSFSGGTQWWAAPVKLAGGLLVAGLICLPSLYIFACLSGSSARLIEVAGLVFGLILLMTLLLMGFAPVAWVFSQSTSSVVGMGVLHLGFGLVALFFGMRFLRQGFAWLNTPFSSGIGVWMVIFTLVVVQMTTALRPIIGTADTFLPTEKKFFLVHWVEQMSGDSNYARSTER